jgi:hypothetical protein
MNGIQIHLVQPLAYRVWDPERHSFFYTDVLPEASPLLDRWTGRFDRQGTALYENDIIRVHYDWRLGWVRALVVRDANCDGYRAQATGPDGKTFLIGFYCFADSYRLGNLRQHPSRLVAAVEQFQRDGTEYRRLQSAAFRSVPRSSFN